MTKIYLIVLSNLIFLGCTITYNYHTHYVPPSFDRPAGKVSVSLGKAGEDKKSPKALFVYFIAPVNSGSIAAMIKGIDRKMAAHEIESIHLLINSGGGQISYALAAYNYLKNLGVKIRTYNLSNVSSAATILYCAGDERYSTIGASFLFHGISINLGRKDMDDVSLSAKRMEYEKEKMIAVYQSCFKDSGAIIQKIFSTGLFVTSPDDVALGLSHETIQKIPAPGKDALLL